MVCLSLHREKITETGWYLSLSGGGVTRASVLESRTEGNKAHLNFSFHSEGN